MKRKITHNVNGRYIILVYLSIKRSDVRRLKNHSDTLDGWFAVIVSDEYTTLPLERSRAGLLLPDRVWG